MNNIRKFLTNPKGSALFYAIIGFVFATFGLRSSLVFAFFYSLFMGSVAGYIPARKLIKQDDYFVRNIQNDRYAVTKQFNGLLKQEQLPKDPSEHAEFAEFLEATEKRHARNGANKIAFPIIAFGFFGLMIIADHKLTPVSALFLLITLFITVSYLRNRATPQKIAALRKKLATPAVQ